MGVKHEYNLVKSIDDVTDEPHEIHRPVSTRPWWKFFLTNAVAAGAGAAAMFLIMGDSFTSTHSHAPAASSGVVTSALALATPVPVTTTTTTTLTEIATSTSVKLTFATGSAEVVSGSEPSDPDGIAGLILDCGGNAEEARAKGCIYDVMMQDWVPAPCYDAPLTAKYLKKGNWTWYADGDGKTTMSDEEMALGNHKIAWMSSDYHREHCVFSWLKIVRALRNNKGISQELLSYDHVLHCSHGALAHEANNDGVGVSAPTNFAKCALYDTWRLAFLPDEHDSLSK